MGLGGVDTSLSPEGPTTVCSSWHALLTEPGVHIPQPSCPGSSYAPGALPKDSRVQDPPVPARKPSPMDPSALSTLPPGRCWPNQRPCSYCLAVSASSGTGFIAIRHAGPKTRVHFKSTKLRPPSACSGCFFIFSRLNSIGPATVLDWKTRNRMRWKVSKLPARRLVSVTRHMLRLLNKC